MKKILWMVMAFMMPVVMYGADLTWDGTSNGGDDSIWDTTWKNWDTTDTVPWDTAAHFAELGSSNVTLGEQVRLTGFDGSGTLDLGANSLRLGGSGVTSTFSGTLNGTGQFVWDSSSIVDLSGTNNATGQSVLRSGGTLRLSSADAWQAGTKAKIETGTGSFTIELAAADEDFNSNLFLNNVNPSGTARFAAVGAERNMTYDSGSGNFVWGGNGRNMGVLGLGNANSTHTLNWTNNINLNGANRTVDALNGSATIGGNISGVISGTGVGLTKTGAGTLKLSAANTYTGMTTVDAGELILDGSVAGAVTVDFGATLSGSGSIDGASTINGMLNPGNSPGTLTFNDALTLESTATLTLELTGTGAGEYDLLLNDGEDTLTAGGTLVFDTTGYTANLGDSFTVFENWGGFDSSFDSISGTDLGGGLSLDTTTLLTTGTITVIPEPATLGLVVAFGGAIVWIRRTFMI